MTSVTTDAYDRNRQRDLAWVEAFAGLSRVAATLSVRLRAVHEVDQSAAAAAAVPSPTNERARPAQRPATARLPRGGFGPRQQSVLALGGLDAEMGLAAAEVANAIGSTASNTHKLLVGLEGLGALERVPDERPVHWRRSQA